MGILFVVNMVASFIWGCLMGWFVRPLGLALILAVGGSLLMSFLFSLL